MGAIEAETLADLALDVAPVGLSEQFGVVDKQGETWGLLATWVP